MGDFPLFPESASTIAPKIDAVYIALVIVSFAFTFAFSFFVLYFAIKYRRGSKADRSNIRNENPKFEALFISIPTVIGIGLFIWGAIVYFEVIAPPGDAIQISIVGKQWMWKAQHPAGSSEINELHVPVGQPIQLRMTSQDVIHSFFIPDFRVKQDVLPGRETSLWFQPTRVGRYRLYCAEYCGTDHSRMVGWVEVMDRARYEAWLEGSSDSTGLATEGERLFRQYHCSGCHGGNATVKAPPLEGVFGGPVPILTEFGTEIIQADERYLRDSIRLPGEEVVAGYEPLMPPFPPEVLPEGDLFKIVAYLKSIGRGSTKRPEEDRDGPELTAEEIQNIMGRGGNDR